LLFFFTGAGSCQQQTQQQQQQQQMPVCEVLERFGCHMQGVWRALCPCTAKAMQSSAQLLLRGKEKEKEEEEEEEEAKLSSNDTSHEAAGRSVLIFLHCSTSARNPECIFSLAVYPISHLAFDLAALCTRGFAPWCVQTTFQEKRTRPFSHAYTRTRRCCSC